MSEEFLKRLRQVADERHKRMYSPGPEAEFLGRRGMECVIEALKEMMVGEPTSCRLEHGYWHWGGLEGTWIRLAGERWFAFSGGHQGTDGEEVIVLAVRLS